MAGGPHKPAAMPKNGNSLELLPATTRKQILAALPHERGKVGATPALLHFILLVARGAQPSVAYRIVRPHVTEGSSRTLGPNLARRHAQNIAALRTNKDLRLALSTDLLHENIILDPQVSASDSLKAADAIDKKLGRFANDGTQVNVFTQGDALLTHLEGATKPISLPADCTSEEE